MPEFNIVYMNLKKSVFLIVLMLLTTLSHSQSMMGGEGNRLGLQAGVNHFDIHTGNFDVEPGISWTAGFTNRSDYLDDYQIIYGINFFDFRPKLQGREEREATEGNEELQYEQLQYTMVGVQASLMGSYKIIGNYLSVEAGPVIQVNGKFKPQQNRETWYVQHYDYQAMDIENVSVFNVNAAAGISGGFESVKFFAQYQYGLTNFLGGLNDEGLEEIDPEAQDFSGNLSIITAGVILFL